MDSCGLDVFRRTLGLSHHKMCPSWTNEILISLFCGCPCCAFLLTPSNSFQTDHSPWSFFLISFLQLLETPEDAALWLFDGKGELCLAGRYFRRYLIYPALNSSFLAWHRDPLIPAMWFWLQKAQSKREKICGNPCHGFTQNPPALVGHRSSLLDVQLVPLSKELVGGGVQSPTFRGC